MPAKRHLNGVLLAGPGWPAYIVVGRLNSLFSPHQLKKQQKRPSEVDPLWENFLDITVAPKLPKVLILVWVFIYIHTFCMLAVMALVTLPLCAGSSDVLLLDNVISTKISIVGSFM